MKKRLLLAASALLMLASIALLVYLSLHEPGAGAPSAAAEPAPPEQAEVRITAPIFTSGPLSTLSPDEQQLAKALQERFGKRLDHPYWRISAIESLIRFLQKKYPNDWRQRLRDLLAKIFPEHADALLSTLEAYDRYNDWLRDAQTSMVYNSREERLKAIWDKRVQLFGQDAYKIWDAQLKQEKVENALATLDKSSQPLSAKIDSYARTLADVYGQKALDPAQSHPVQQMEDFLRLGSVQDELHRQTPEQQKQALRQLRSAMGLKEEALQRLETLDEQRTQRATAGETYMAQRAALERQYQGEALQVQVTALQNRLFGEEEARFIRNEEASGFYRYKERQVIGVN